VGAGERTGRLTGRRHRRAQAGAGGRRAQAAGTGRWTGATGTQAGTQAGTTGGTPPGGVGVVTIDPQFTSAENKSGPKRLLDCVMCCLFCLRVSKRGAGEWKRGLLTLKTPK